MTEQEKLKAIRTIANAVLESIGAAGELGAPSGHLYAALSQYGASLSEYEQFMAGLEAAGMVSRSGFLYRLTERGAAMVKR